MARRCDICGKGPMAGRTYTRKGKAKKEGGVGRHIARKNKRRFMPNLQPVRAVINGIVKRIVVCTRCIKKGRVTRPTPKFAAKAAAA
ncbi:MAG: 50S ribosomal protein L28 [Candidatus Omnitrophota bacterium]|nr:50S ribosomal protein L28 [Candidatus Omnitrophota bacterium]